MEKQKMTDQSLIDALALAAEAAPPEETVAESTHTHVDDLAPAAPPKNRSFSQVVAAKKAKKALEKRTKRVAELKERGLSDEVIKMHLAKEEYESEPIHIKLMRIESMMAQGMQNLAAEMVALRQNDEILADAMDINFRAISKALAEAGISLEKQKEIIQSIEKEVEADRKAQAEAMNKARIAASKATQEKEKVSELTADADKPGEPEPPPPEATSFGG